MQQCNVTIQELKDLEFHSGTRPVIEDYRIIAWMLFNRRKNEERYLRLVHNLDKSLVCVKGSGGTRGILVKSAPASVLVQLDCLEPVYFKDGPRYIMTAAGEYDIEQTWFRHFFYLD